MEYYDHIVDTIGNTPLIKLHSFKDRMGTYLVKVEAFNPGRSSKDRIAMTIIEDAERKGLLKPGSGTIVEATSGNTGLGLALVAKKKGYEVVLVMPDKMSPDKMNLVKAIGCEVVVCPTEVEPDDPRSYYSVSKKLAKEIEGAFFANQYHNEANPLAHYQSTGPEIWRQTDGKITHFICGVGTGGTISGVAKYLKEKNPDIKVIGIDPKGSILAHYHKYRNTDIKAHGYKTEGVGEDIIPDNVHFDLIDDFVVVNDQEAFEWTRTLATKEGILVGPSSGMAVCGAYKYAIDIDDEAVVVILLPDTGERYLSKVFSESWLRANGFLPAPTKVIELLQAKSANLPPIISVSKKESIANSIDKISKFNIDQLLIEQDDDYLLLRKDILYNCLLGGTSPDNSITNLSFEVIQKFDINGSINDLIKVILKQDTCLITSREKIVGVLTKQDILDNIDLKVLPSYLQ